MRKWGGGVKMGGDGRIEGRCSGRGKGVWRRWRKKKKKMGRGVIGWGSEEEMG